MENNNFNYSYSAREQKEVEHIRDKYLPKEENKLETLRRLDASVTELATVISLIIGIAGTLLLGFGMSCCMVFDSAWFVPGIIIGIIGIGVVLSAYPVYGKLVRHRRAKIAPMILAISEELMK